MARAADGTLYVSRFGFGTTGGVAIVKADGSVGAIAGVDPSRRRIGLAVAPDGALYDAWFEKHGDGPGGEVARLSLDGQEAVAMTGLRKPVGLLVLGDSLYVSDQAAGRVLRAPLATPSSASTFAADVPGADLLCAGPSGAIFAGGGAVVYRIDASGHASALVSGLPKARGVAYDPSARRLFVSEHDLEPGRTRHQIRIVPVP
jgi:sugar lactone lactonase YvrE